MKIPRTKINESAEVLLSVMEREDLYNLEPYGEPIRTFTVEDSPDEFIEAQIRPSNAGTVAYTVSYVVEGVGIPLEVKINSSLGYTKFIVKSSDSFEGYNSFASDGDNVAQDKTITSCDPSSIKRELEFLQRA